MRIHDVIYIPCIAPRVPNQSVQGSEIIHGGMDTNKITFIMAKYPMSRLKFNISIHQHANQDLNYLVFGFFNFDFITFLPFRSFDPLIFKQI
jgi:hypothetical protein